VVAEADLYEIVGAALRGAWFLAVEVWRTHQQSKAWLAEGRCPKCGQVL
jgi:hypothetical protein